MRYEATYYNQGHQHVIFNNMTIKEIWEFIKRTEPDAYGIDINRVYARTYNTSN